MTLFSSYPDWVLVLLYSSFAGLAIPVGAYIAKIEHITPNWLEIELRHFVIAFGGGVLLAAVTLVLIPEGIKNLSPFLAIGIFLCGGITFYFIDRLIEKHGGNYSQLIAMMADFVPEAMALGAMLIDRNPATLLLVLLISLQNLPEGFNAYREIIDKGKHEPKHIMMWFYGLVLVGPFSAFIGAELLSGDSIMIAGVMMFSSGGILYLVFQDIAPQAHFKKKWAPPLGAVLGYALGLLGHLLL